MIQNVTLKKFLKGTVCKLVTCANKVLPKSDAIVLLYMGNKGIGFNLAPLYDYLITNGYNKNYHIVCSVESEKYYGEAKENVTYVNHIGGLKYFLRAKHVFYTAGQLPIKPSNKQIVIHMNHGITDYKTVGALTKINNGDEFYFTYMIASSPLYVPIIAKEYLCKAENIKICNEPMTERIIKPQNKYDLGTYSKILLWVPTFRQSDYLGYDDSSIEAITPLYEDKDYDGLNAILKKHNFLIIVKLHPSQSTDKYKQIMFSNLKIYSHQDFVETGMNLYDLMAQVDGLIGDYSSASLQFLLTEKPQAFVIPDFEEYKEKRGFVFDNPRDYMPGHLIYDKCGFEEFLNDFANGIDPYREKRKKVKAMIHTYDDTNSCKRLLDLSKIYRSGDGQNA